MITKKAQAYCLSDVCNYNAGRDIGKTSEKLKDVPFSTKECPDCRHMLFWRRLLSEEEKQQNKINARLKYRKNY